MRAPPILMLRGGLIRALAQDPTIGSEMINARAETLVERSAFRTGLQRQGCLVPADEWKCAAAKRTPMRIVLKNSTSIDRRLLLGSYPVL